MLSFTAPDGWELPPDAKPGQPFKAVATIVADKDGNLNFTEIDGSPLSDGAEDDESEETEPDDEEAEGEPTDHMGEMVDRAKAAGLMK
jgi:hypothetical protein